MKTAINLLPPFYRRQRLVRRRAIQWSVVLVAALSAIGAARWYKGHEYRALEQQLAAVTREGRPTQVMLREITKMRAQIEKLQHHQTIAQELEQQRHVLALLGAVSSAAGRTAGRLRVVDCRVADLQATEVAENHGEGAVHPGAVTLVGVALDSPTVAEFHDGLLRSGLFADVKLIKSNERSQSGPELFDYEVRCELQLLATSAMSSPVLDNETLRFGRLLHYAGLAIVLVAGAAAFSWFYTPVERNILDTQMRIDELVVSGQNAEAIRNKHQSLSSQLQDIESRYSALEERVPLNAEAGNFLKHVSEIAREEQLSISNFQPSQSVDGNGFTAMEVMLDGKGTFKSICSFFERLSKIQRLSKVKDLSVSVDPQSDEYPMKATIVIYYGLKGETAAAAGEEVSRG